MASLVLASAYFATVWSGSFTPSECGVSCVGADTAVAVAAANAHSDACNHFILVFLSVLYSLFDMKSCIARSALVSFLGALRKVIRVALEPVVFHLASTISTRHTAGQASHHFFECFER